MRTLGCQQVQIGDCSAVVLERGSLWYERKTSTGPRQIWAVGPYMQQESVSSRTRGIHVPLTSCVCVYRVFIVCVSVV